MSIEFLDQPQNLEGWKGKFFLPYKNMIYFSEQKEERTRKEDSGEKLIY